MGKTPPPPPTPSKKKTTRARKVTPINLTTVDRDGMEVTFPIPKISGARRPGVPSIDPHYVFRTEMVRELLWSIWPHDDGAPAPVLLGGPKGCGKTSLVMQVAARINQPVYRVNLNVGTTTRHLKGRVGAADGATEFVPGIATLAMEEGAWLLLDEISGATPPVALCLFPILEFDPPGEVLLEDAQPPRYVDRHPDFRVFATDNTIGASQEESRFSFGGTNPDMNVALLDRFGTFIQTDYLTPEQEFTMVFDRVPNADDLALEGMIRVANNVRDAKDLDAGFSTRMVFDWARRFAAGRMGDGGKIEPHTLDQVLKIAKPAFLDKMRSDVDRKAVAEVIRRVFALGEG